jgi:prefoldin subunit 5
LSASPSTKAAAAAGSSGQGSSSHGSSRPSAPARIIDLSTEEPAVQVAEAGSDTQQTEPEPQPAGSGNTKKDKERQRKERQRHRKIEEAVEALDRAMALLAHTGDSVEAVEEAMQAAAKHDGRSEPLAALVAEAKGMVEQARAVEAERAKVAAEEAKVRAAVKAVVEAEEAAERLQM